MIAVAAVVTWMGYSLIYYGLDQVRGGNNGFFSLVIPGKYKNVDPDTGSEKKNASASPGGGQTPLPSYTPGGSLITKLPSNPAASPLGALLHDLGLT